MTINQAMYKGIYEGILTVFFKAKETMDVGDVVQLDTVSGYPYVCKCASSGVPFGYAAQAVTTSGYQAYEPGGFTMHTAAVGDYVGVYVGGGIYNTLNATSAVYGNECYAGTTSAGKLATASASSGIKVGICVKTKDGTTGIAKVKSYL